MARTYRGLALLVLAVASTASLDAQHRQFVLTTGVLFEVETDPRGYGQVRAPVPVLPSFRSAFPGELHVVAGGRYLAWATVTGALSVASTSVLSVFDVHTRHVQVLSLVSFANVPPAVAFRLIGDPLRPRLLVQHSTRVAIIDPPRGLPALPRAAV